MPISLTCSLGLKIFGLKSWRLLPNFEKTAQLHSITALPQFNNLLHTLNPHKPPGAQSVNQSINQLVLPISLTSSLGLHEIRPKISIGFVLQIFILGKIGLRLLGGTAKIKNFNLFYPAANYHVGQNGAKTLGGHHKN